MGTSDTPPNDGGTPNLILTNAAYKDGTMPDPSAIRWRCLAGEPLWCRAIGNVWCGVADMSSTAPDGVSEYCQAHPHDSDVGRAVAGRATVFQWGCSDGVPFAVRVVLDTDERGYFTYAWHKLK
jgi:hypothetical protein